MIFYGVGMLISLYWVYRSLTTLLDIIQLRKRGIFAEAKVVMNRETWEGKNEDDASYEDPLKPNYIAVYEFMDKNGNEFVVNNFKDKSDRKERIGKKKKVLYDPENPEVHYLDVESKQMLNGIMLIFAILLFSVFSYLVLS